MKTVDEFLIQMMYEYNELGPRNPYWKRLKENGEFVLEQLGYYGLPKSLNKDAKELIEHLISVAHRAQLKYCISAEVANRISELVKVLATSMREGNDFSRKLNAVIDIRI